MYRLSRLVEVLRYKEAFYSICCNYIVRYNELLGKTAQSVVLPICCNACIIDRLLLIIRLENVITIWCVPCTISITWRHNRNYLPVLMFNSRNYCTDFYRSVHEKLYRVSGLISLQSYIRLLDMKPKGTSLAGHPTKDSIWSVFQKICYTSGK